MKQGMLNANRGDIESRTILIAMKLEPTVRQGNNYYPELELVHKYSYLTVINLLMLDFHMNA
jgi:hypothetical protein